MNQLQLFTVYRPLICTHSAYKMVIWSCKYNWLPIAGSQHLSMWAYSRTSYHCCWLINGQGQPIAGSQHLSIWAYSRTSYHCCWFINGQGQPIAGSQHLSMWAYSRTSYHCCWFINGQGQPIAGSQHLSIWAYSRPSYHCCWFINGQGQLFLETRCNWGQKYDGVIVISGSFAGILSHSWVMMMVLSIIRYSRLDWWDCYAPR